jgi:hypothetical protein
MKTNDLFFIPNYYIPLFSLLSEDKSIPPKT